MTFETRIPLHFCDLLDVITFISLLCIVHGQAVRVFTSTGALYLRMLDVMQCMDSEINLHVYSRLSNQIKLNRTVLFLTTVSHDQHLYLHCTKYFQRHHLLCRYRCWSCDNDAVEVSAVISDGCYKT